MIYKFLFLQSLVFLLISPLIREYIIKDNISYNFIVPVTFILFFYLGGRLINYNNYKTVKVYRKIDTSYLLIILWFTLVSIVVFTNELYLTRIGSEVAAFNRSQLNILDLVIYKSFRIAAPFLAAVIIFNIFYNEKSYFKKLINIILLIIIFFNIGGFDSKSIIFILLIYVCIFIFYLIDFKKWCKLVIILLFSGILFFVLIMNSRYQNDANNNSLIDHFKTEIINRTDGIELMQRYIDARNPGYFTTNFESLYFPIVSHLFFLEESKELKSIGQTSVKSYILKEELGIKKIDFNYSIVSDIFYLFGILGVILWGLMTGYFAKIVDYNGFINTSGKFNIPIIALSITIFPIETDFLSFIFDLFKNYIIITLVLISGIFYYKNE